ncbi:MAG: S49 family peptidase, partial [Clostridia bacterium]|nr:S49 family peptidase [Deltaproteobacteria bacterium]
MNDNREHRGFFGTLGILIRVAFGLAMLLSFVLVLVALFASHGPKVPNRGVLHLQLGGALVEHQEIDITAILRGPLPRTLRSVTDSIRRAAADERILGVLLEVDSPEIGLAQLQELEDAMAVFRASGKWTCAFLETAGDGDRGNAAYAAAILADKVLLAPPGDVNLVGIRSEAMFFAGLLEKLDVGVHFEQRYEYKNAANQFTQKAFTPAHRESTVALVDSLQGDLVRHIAARRKVDEAKAWEWVRGGPYLANRALEEKLVDGLQYWDEVCASAEHLAGGKDRLVTLETYANEKKLYDSGPTIGV